MLKVPTIGKKIVIEEYAIGNVDASIALVTILFKKENSYHVLEDKCMVLRLARKDDAFLKKYFQEACEEETDFEIKNFKERSYIEFFKNGEMDRRITGQIYFGSKEK